SEHLADLVRGALASANRSVHVALEDGCGLRAGPVDPAHRLAHGVRVPREQPWRPGAHAAVDPGLVGPVLLEVANGRAALGPNSVVRPSRHAARRAAGSSRIASLHFRPAPEPAVPMKVRRMPRLPSGGELSMTNGRYSAKRRSSRSFTTRTNMSRLS